MGTNYPKAIEYTMNELLTESFNEFRQKHGVGKLAINERYEALRELVLTAIPIIKQCSELKCDKGDVINELSTNAYMWLVGIPE